jgi:FlaA1/EpsC-like NDP-sugar epimerase
MAWLSPTQLIKYRRSIIVAGNIAIIPAAYLGAFLLRFDFRIPGQYWNVFLSTVPFVLMARLVVFHYFGLYRGYWRHVSMRDLVDLVAAATVSSGVFLGALFLLKALPELPRSILLLDWLMIVFLSGGLRFAARWIREGRLSLRPDEGKRTLVIGAGESAAWLLRQPLHDGRDELLVVGLVDDDPNTHGRSLHGVPVVGDCAHLETHAVRYRAELLVIAVPSATGEQIRRIVAQCEVTGVDFKIVPTLRELLAGRARINQLREVSVQDLLGRDPVSMDLEALHDLADRCVLVTGGAGSIGSELARQIAGYRPRKLVLLDQAESPLYYVHRELVDTYPDVDVVPLIADITDPVRVESAFATFRPEYVFHAAAYKHVPLLESNRIEAAKNNVLGTLFVAEAAVQHGTKRFVLISTDKAVNPTSMLGATKRAAERVVLELASLGKSDTDFRAVRFGNVLGSEGSVIPVFKRQIAAGGPITVTHPEVERYFMTIPEAVQLVLQAGVIPEAAGRICMLEMGESMSILDLAEELISLSGLVPYQDIDIVFTGLRPGEKLREELVGENESTISTSIEKIHIVQCPNGNGVDLSVGMERLHAAIRSGEAPNVDRALAPLVPEYAPWCPPVADAVGPTATDGGRDRLTSESSVPSMASAPGGDSA